MWSNCDKCPIEHLSLGCHHHQGCALFNPAHRQPLPPLPKRSAGQRRSVCVRSGTGRFPKASRLNKHARRRAEKCVCVCVTITCVYPAVTLYMITTGRAYVSMNIRDANTHFFLGFFFSLDCVICSWLYSPGPLFVLTGSMYCCFHLYIHAFHKAYVTR